MQLDALFTLGFPSASFLKNLTLLHTYTRRTVLQKVRHRTHKVLCLLVNTWFQVLFTPLPGFFSPFLHSTASLSVTREYLGLGGGPPGFPQGFSCLVVLWILLAASRFRLPGFHRLRLAFPKPFVYLSALLIAVRNPEEPGPSVWPLSRSLAAT